MRSSYYEFRIAGVLPAEALLDYEQLTASLEPVETVRRAHFRIRQPFTASSHN